MTTNHLQPTALHIAASDADGVSYQNPFSDAKVRILCTAVGSWTYNPDLAWHTADGSEYRMAGPLYLLPNLAAEGELIVLRGSTGGYERVGSLRQFDLEPDEIIRFICNDGPAGFGDNQGIVTLTIQPTRI